MYTKLDTRLGSELGSETKTGKTDKPETIRQGDCGCACNSATEVPEEPDGVIVARNFTTNQLQVDLAGGDGG